MGSAVIIPGIQFNSGLGKVTLVGDTIPSSLQIIADNNYVGWKKQLDVRFFPYNTAKRGVTWSVINGSEYATIDNNGVLTINENSDNSNITVRVESNESHSVYNDKNITVSYTPEITIHDKISIYGNPTINTGLHLVDEHDSIEIKYAVIGTSAHTGTLWGSLDEHTSCYIDDMTSFIVDFLADNDRRPITTGSIINYNQATLVGEIVTDEFFYDHATRNGLSMGIRSTIYGEGVTPSDDIYILHPNVNYRFAKIDIYFIRFKRSGEIVHEFKAADKSGVPGLYDEYSDLFITNTGNSGILEV